jgi:hypothetical protein
MVQPWVKNLVKETLSHSTQQDGKKLVSIQSPAIGQEVLYKNEHGKFVPVRVKDGQFWGTYGVSNFWYWDVLNESGGVIESTCGYGNFYIEE